MMQAMLNKSNQRGSEDLSGVAPSTVFRYKPKSWTDVAGGYQAPGREQAAKEPNLWRFGHKTDVINFIPYIYTGTFSQWNYYTPIFVQNPADLFGFWRWSHTVWPQQVTLPPNPFVEEPFPGPGSPGGKKDWHTRTVSKPSPGNRIVYQAMTGQDVGLEVTPLGAPQPYPQPWPGVRPNPRPQPQPSPQPQPQPQPQPAPYPNVSVSPAPSLGLPPPTVRETKYQYVGAPAVLAAVGLVTESLDLWNAFLDALGFEYIEPRGGAGFWLDSFDSSTVFGQQVEYLMMYGLSRLDAMQLVKNVFLEWVEDRFYGTLSEGANNGIVNSGYWSGLFGIGAGPAL